MERTPRSQEVLDWRAAVIAGLVAGIVAIAVQSILYAVYAQGSTWVTLRYLAALAMGDASLPPPASFDLTTAVVGGAVGLLGSVVFTLIVAFVVHRWRLLFSTIGGMLLGFALYLINSYLMAAPFPCFIAASSDFFRRSRSLCLTISLSITTWISWFLYRSTLMPVTTSFISPSTRA